MRTLEDIIKDDLRVLFCGINPGLKAFLDGHHFTGRGNRFWRALHLSGFTPHEIAPENDRTLLEYGCGLTTFVERPTAGADELTKNEFDASAGLFYRKIERFRPRHIVFLGKQAFQSLSGEKTIPWGLQALKISDIPVWVLPNPSGRNRGFTLEVLVLAYRQAYLTTRHA
ncbi:G/U mismatch-specific DNA glycosylase [Puia sp.]|jgi:TDG/mug DNA glycosylase family protein|uniref:G/U mismatch-specific DNA glycosylase n=1 Tax=Puia sp. TaxID=2045100 RepID=UPI002F41AF6E